MGPLYSCYWLTSTPSADAEQIDHEDEGLAAERVTATSRAVELAAIAAEAAADKLASDIIAYDVSEQLVITDVFLLCWDYDRLKTVVWAPAGAASVGLLELKYGIMPDLGGTQRLPRLVGPGKAKELIFTSARIDADEAYRIGLCEQLVSDEELGEAAETLAATIALSIQIRRNLRVAATHSAPRGAANSCPRSMKPSTPPSESSRTP